MACRAKVLVAVGAVFLGLIAEQQVTFVNGDKQLIMAVYVETIKTFPCDGCDLPLLEACGQCLTYTPGSIDMDVKGLARAALGCAIRESRAVLTLADGSREGVANSDTCLAILQDEDLQIRHALKSFQEGRYVDAAKQVRANPKTAHVCSSELSRPGGTKDTLNHITTLQLLRNVATGVLVQIR